MKRVLLLSLTLVAVIYTSYDQPAKKTDMVKKEVFGIHQSKEVYLLTLTNKAGNGDIIDHELIIKASAFTPVDSADLPTGEIRPVAGTPFDFTTPHTIGERIGEKYEQLIIVGGYDHNYVLDNKEEVDVTVYEPVSGRLLEVIIPIARTIPIFPLRCLILVKHLNQQLFTDFQLNKYNDS